MLTREETDQIIHHCQEKGQTYKDYLAEHNIPAWKFYAAKKKYFQDSEEKGSFLQLKPSGLDQISEFFSNSPSSRPSQRMSKKEPRTTLVNVELKTVTGNLVRIQGELTSKTLQEIILASSGYVQS